LRRVSLPLANGIGTMTSAAKPSVARFAARPILILFVLCLVPGLAAVVWRAKARADAGQIHARTAAQARGTAVELQLSQALTAAEVLGALARQSGGGISDFQKVALELLASRPGLASLELQPGGVVSDIVPRAGHERAIGFNVLKDVAQRPGAYAAIQRRGLTVTGPLTLFHGEPGIVVRVPVFQRGRDGRDYFWGFIAVSMPLPEALARARVDELWKQGYNYAFFAPASSQQKVVPIAARGAMSFQDAVQQPVRAQNLEFRLALRPRGGWVNATKVALESVGVLVISALLCLVANLLGRQGLANETAERSQTPKDGSGAKDSAAGAPAEFTLAELQDGLKGTVRRAPEINGLAQTKLKQAELSERELQTRLDATVRAAEESARAKQAELEQARLALAQAQQAISELQGRLEAAASSESKTATAAQARLQQDQATIGDLTARMDGAKRSAKEAAEASAARLHQAEKRNRELTRRLLAAETRVTELSALLQKAQGDLKRLQIDSARSIAGPAPIGPVPSEPKEPRSGEAVILPVEGSTASRPAIAVLAEPVEQTSATILGEKLSPVPSESRGEPLAVPPTTTGSKADSSAPPTSHEAPAEAGADRSVPRGKRKSARMPKREQVRGHDQIDLFEGQLEAAQTPANPAPNARAIASAENTRLPARGLAPTATASARRDVEDSAADPVKQVTAQPPSEPQAPGAGLGNPAATTTALLGLPVIEGLAATEGLARAGDNPKLYVKSLQHFVEQHTSAPEKIREALQQGDLAAAERMVQSLRTSASDIGASAVQSAAATMARTVHEPPDPVETESRWKELDKVVRDLVADLKPVLKPKEAKPAPARRMPAPPLVNPAQLRKAANEIVLLLAEQDPGAKDCLKANRTTFRSAFTAEAFEEFEQCVKTSDFGTALEQLKKAAKRYGISL
jgi:sensor domain CHASE-containing protein/HPt (histidine-containing phosphotransfer) domain-containing protein